MRQLGRFVDFDYLVHDAAIDVPVKVVPILAGAIFEVFVDPLRVPRLWTAAGVNVVIVPFAVVLVTFDAIIVRAVGLLARLAIPGSIGVARDHPVIGITNGVGFIAGDHRLSCHSYVVVVAPALKKPVALAANVAHGFAVVDHHDISPADDLDDVTVAICVVDIRLSNDRKISRAAAGRFAALASRRPASLEVMTCIPSRGTMLLAISCIGDGSITVRSTGIVLPTKTQSGLDILNPCSCKK